MKKFFNWVKGKVNKVVGAVSAITTAVAVTVSTFAAAGDGVAIQASDLAPLLEGAKENIGVIIPVGIGLMAMVLGIGFIPTIVKTFKK